MNEKELRRKLLILLRIALYKKALDILTRDYLPEIRLAFERIGEASGIALCAIREFLREIERYEKR